MLLGLLTEEGLVLNGKFDFVGLLKGKYLSSSEAKLSVSESSTISLRMGDSVRSDLEGLGFGIIIVVLGLLAEGPMLNGKFDFVGLLKGKYLSSREAKLSVSGSSSTISFRMGDSLRSDLEGLEFGVHLGTLTGESMPHLKIFGDREIEKERGKE